MDTDTEDDSDNDSGRMERAKWSVGRRTRADKQRARKKLEELSGDDIVPMLRDVLTKEEILLLTGQKEEFNEGSSGEEASSNEEAANKDMSFGEEEEDVADEDVCSEKGKKSDTGGDEPEAESGSESECRTIVRSCKRKRRLRPRRDSEEMPDEDDDTPRARRSRALRLIREKKISSSDTKEENRASSSASKKRPAISSSSDSDGDVPVTNSRRSLDFERGKKYRDSYSEEEEDIVDASALTDLDQDSQDDKEASTKEDEPDSEDSQYSYDDSNASEDEECEEQRNGTVREELDSVLKFFRRESDHFQELTDQYLTESPAKRTPKEKKPKSIIYEPLMVGLRKMASQKGLSDPEIVREFVCYQTSEAEDCDGECICRKTGLRHLFHMHNKNVKDKEQRALYHSTIVGSECINWFRKALDAEDESPLVLFDNFTRKGVSATFKESVVTEHHHEDLIFTLPGKSRQFLLKNRESVALQYDLPIKYRGENIVQLTVCPGKYVRHANALKPCTRYRIFLKCNIEKSEELPYPVTFELTRFSDSRKVEREREMKKGASAKSFLA